MSSGGELYQIRCSRPDSSYQWGFRLEGGSDLGTPLRIQKISQNSISERAGLQANDYVTKINSLDTQYLTHEQAKMEIIRSGNDLVFVVQRGGQTIWKPKVTPSQELNKAPVSTANQYGPYTYQGGRPEPQGMSSGGGNYAQDTAPLATRTSLAANKPTQAYIGSSHNAVAKPFASVLSGGVITESDDGRTKKIVHNPYNSPLGLYSQQNAADSFQQTFKSVKAPTPIAKSADSAAPASMYCGACGDMIKGVFVKVQNRIPMHPACLKCCKCGVGLRNVGYFYINDQLYCETHAKQVSRPPGPGLQPMPVYK